MVACVTAVSSVSAVKIDSNFVPLLPSSLVCSRRWFVSSFLWQIGHGAGGLKWVPKGIIPFTSFQMNDTMVRWACHFLSPLRKCGMRIPISSYYVNCLRVRGNGASSIFLEAPWIQQQMKFLVRYLPHSSTCVSTPCSPNCTRRISYTKLMLMTPSSCCEVRET